MTLNIHYALNLWFFFSYRPHSSRAVRLDGGRHGTVFWRISCLLSGREEHLRTFLCLLLQVRRAENIWHRLSIVRLESGIVSHAPVIIHRASETMNICVVRVGEFLMNMMMFDPMGFGRGTPNVFRYWSIRPIRRLVQGFDQWQLRMCQYLSRFWTM